MNSIRRNAPPLSIALFTLSCVISGCEGGSPAPPQALLASRAARVEGARLFAAHCAICHGESGDGEGRRRSFMTPLPANLTLPPWSTRAGAPRTFLAIRDGVPETAMASWPDLSDRQTWQLVAYIETLGQGQ
ncbi:MAG TPA: cytochrome c [Steroidobacteraceae bacterium]|nr:cytochrome c [Steroidobacteraceae bacterium]